MTTPPLSCNGILAVVVVYKTQPADCLSMITLMASIANLPAGSPPVSVIVADNTPNGQQIKQLPNLVRYTAYEGNPGLARPYNDALLQAELGGFGWLLTLDQDTSLPGTFLRDMLGAARTYQGDSTVAAIVPRIVDGQRVISPFRYVGGFLPIVYSTNKSGLVGPHASALNSASLLRVSALRELGGYDESFPLHNSDTRLYQQLNEAGKRIAVAAHVVVPHELSILDRENRMSPERYRRMLEDECEFWDSHMGMLGRMERLVRLVGRYCKGILSGEQVMFQRVTLEELRRRLLTRRTNRIRRHLSNLAQIGQSLLPPKQ
ncbi:hypothetical protein [Terriglobus roseus]|uniref:Glycosyltransferase, GT2 family n=1 Tax=Terriglobus roseus TaxID=392734 RepID=A0A1G7NC91_9BACT|nr:hypothetical protein [Terriglobus roseus]SDF71517.1 Glycosyltransferase, GT2 family [Terriglobus roseus]